MTRRYEDEDILDAADRAYEDHRQRMVDAYADGRKVGRMGLGAGLCPQDLGIAERNEWLLGFHAGAAQLLSERRAA